MNGTIQSVPVSLPDGTKMWVEARALGPRETDVAAFAGLPEALSFDAVRHALEGMASLVRDAMNKAKPDKASVELGLELGLESGQLTALLVKGSGNANLKVTLSWENLKSDD